MRAYLPIVALLLFQGTSSLNAQGILIGWDLPVNSTVDSVIPPSHMHGALAVGLQTGHFLGRTPRPTTTTFRLRSRRPQERKLRSQESPG
ncbi:MAG: hypothetical protein EBT48_04120 [Verrucomicrobia bacterium]|nr:hypothetical protein [Verrucomicrobiota bacterium]